MSTVEEGQPLTFTASFDTLPPFEPGDYATIALQARRRRGRRRSGATRRCSGCAIAAARYEPVEGRGVDRRRHGDASISSGRDAGGAQPTRTRTSAIELGAKANPPGFDEQLLGLEAGATKTFTIHYPADYPIERAGRTPTSRIRSR